MQCDKKVSKYQHPPFEKKCQKSIMYLYGIFTAALIFIFLIIVLYITSRIILIVQVESGEMHTKQLAEKINKFLYAYLSMEIIASTISIIPPILSPVLFAITLLSTANDIYLVYSKTFLIPSGVVRKSLDSLESRFLKKLLIWLAAFGYFIYLIFKESQRKNMEIRTSQLL